MGLLVVLEHSRSSPLGKSKAVLVVSQLLDPGREFRVHRQWYLTTTAMDFFWDLISPWLKRIGVSLPVSCGWT